MKPIKVLSHKIKIDLVKRMQESDTDQAQMDTQVKEAKVSIMADNGRRRPLSGIMVSIVHEFGHEADFVTNHSTFYDDNEELDAAKDDALDALAEVVVQILLDNNLLNPDWLQALKDEINRVWRNDRG